MLMGGGVVWARDLTPKPKRWVSVLPDVAV